MSGFEPHDAGKEEKSENIKDSEIRVVKLETNRSTSASEYQFQDLTQIARESNQTKFYGNRREVLKAHRDSLELRRKNRFALDGEVRDSLKVDERERSEIEERVQAEVAKLAAEEKKTAREKGYQEGFEDGRLKAFEEFKAQAKSKMDSIELFLRSFEAAKSRIFKENEKFLIDMIYHIGKTLALKEIQEDRNYVVKLAKDIIERVGLSENIRIKVNPKDLERIEELRAEITKEISGLKNLTIEGSDKVGGGGCIVETAWNEIDASIDRQINNIYKALVDRQIVKESDTQDAAEAPVSDQKSQSSKKSDSGDNS